MKIHCAIRLPRLDFSFSLSEGLMRNSLIFPRKIFSCCERDYQINIIRLDLCFMRRATAHRAAAFFAAVGDDVAFLAVGICTDGNKQTAAGVFAVARHYIHMNRAETARAVVSRRVSERKDRKPTVAAHKAVVIFLKFFALHKIFAFPR